MARDYLPELANEPEENIIGGVAGALDARTSTLSIGLTILNFGPALILVLLIAVLSISSPYFLTARNISNILAQTAVISVVAMGQQLVILTRGIDLSVGSNLALASVLGALAFHAGAPAALVIAVMVLSGAAVGAINGGFYVFGRLPHPFIITLATLSIAKGLALQLADGRAIPGMPPAISALGTDALGGLPGSVFVVLAVAAVFFVVTRTMVWGRWIYAVGGRPDAALRMGIPVSWVLVSTYVVSGTCAGIGAVILAGRTDAGSPLFGNLLELDTIAAVIIGGASFLGGRGHLGNALIGALMIGVIRNALNLLNVNIFFQLIVIGVVIVIAVEGDVLRNYLEGRVRVMQAGKQS
ncbi:ABC transporter permease [Mesorhizobium sp. M2E.F.Ca.ET.166.01.1.1]|nr:MULTISPECIES: ABC transporter permease [unclassified Mesorhizobium]TGQ04768.1 ABC transporter permease [Mesorhizobium sp. M2E.F.Ca.ET.219.01.1.1]TGT65522.1 ABC transporter permease [Mesorhizobium sp. M2E.F.Ca.ET.166.01.1.1]TGV97569.1 ABC transporter permease [Mesorhizobium sp. M2E.F.Ca.ET.154.01.1.1]